MHESMRKETVARNENKAVKAGFFYTVVNFLTKGAVFFTTPLFTRIMSADDIGAYANISSWLQVLIPLVTFDITVSLGIARFDYRAELKKYISSALIYGTCITAFFYCIVLANIDFFTEFFSMPEYTIHILFIYIMVYPALQMYQSQNMFEFRYKVSTAISLTSLLISTGLSLVMTVCFEKKLLARTVGYYVPLILLCACIYVYLLVRGKSISFKYLKYALVVSFPMIWHTMSLHILSAGDRIIITKYLGETPNALYSVAYTCAHVASVLYGSMNSAWSPWSATKMDSGETEQMKKASRPYIAFYCLAAFAMLLVCPELLLIMGGRNYVQAKYVLPPVIVSCVCQFVYSLYINAEFFLKKQTRIAIGTIIAAALNIYLNIIFVPKYGYVAAAYTTLFGYLCLLVFHYTSLKLLKKGYWYDNKFNFAVVIVSVLLIPIFNFLYSHSNIRYGVVCAFSITCAAVLWRYREQAISFFRTKFLEK